MTHPQPWLVEEPHGTWLICPPAVRLKWTPHDTPDSPVATPEHGFVGIVCTRSTPLAPGRYRLRFDDLPDRPLTSVDLLGCAWIDDRRWRAFATAADRGERARLRMLAQAAMLAVWQRGDRPAAAAERFCRIVAPTVPPVRD